MFCGHLARVAGRSACHPRPELTNLGEMGRPVLDAFVEHRTNQSVLPNIRVKMSKQLGDSLLATNPIKQAWVTLIHIVDRRIARDNYECELSATSHHFDNVESLSANGLIDRGACLLDVAKFAFLGA